MSGTAIALIGPSRQGVENITRTWTINDLGGAQINLNRTWPGREDGNTVERHSWLITHKLIRGNVDIAIDHHTGGTGIDFARFVFAYGDDPASVELGGARGFVAEMVEMGVIGNANVLAHYGVLPGPLGQTAKDRGVFVETVGAVAGGFVTLNDAVTKGQKLAVQRNGFGDVVHEYLAPADGRVAIIGIDAATERGGEIATILVKRESCAAEECTDGGITP